MRRRLAFALVALLTSTLVCGCSGPKPDYGSPAPNYNPAAEREDYYPEPAPESQMPIAAEPQDGAKPLQRRYLGSMGRAVEVFEGLTPERLKQATDESQDGEAFEEADPGVEPQSPDGPVEEPAEPRDAAAPERPD